MANVAYVKCTHSLVTMQVDIEMAYSQFSRTFLK